MKQENKKSVLAVAGLVLSIISICTCFIPIINNASFFLGVLAIIFAIISLIKKTSKGSSIAALVLGILSIIITISLQNSWSNNLDNLSNDLDTMTGKNTEEVLKNVDVNIGSFQTTTDEYGFNDTGLIAADGSRIDTDYIYANNLASGQSQDFNLFEYVSSDNLNKMKNATFKVIEASMY